VDKPNRGGAWIYVACCLLGSVFGILGGFACILLFFFDAETTRSWSGDESGMSAIFAIQSLLSLVLGAFVGLIAGWCVAVRLSGKANK
jgi:ABC-type xylose transport system permease subunit